MKDYDVIVVGDLNPDLVLTGDVVPAFGQTEKVIDDARVVVGSSAGIFACGAARLGLRVAFAGLVGDDAFGAFMRGALAERGVDTSGVVVTGRVTTGVSVILSQVNDRAILTHLGTIAALRLAHIDMGLVARARHLHLASYFLLAGLRPEVPALFDQAHALGLTVSLDTNYDPAEAWDSGVRDALARADIFLPNATEAVALTGASDTAAALGALAAVTPAVVVKLAGEGAIARRGEETAAARAYPVDVADTTGAGDSFDAGFIYGWLNGWGLERCLRMACACGSLSTRAVGGIAGQPTAAEALALVSSTEE
ncbi:MAG: carbohydrate kinase family protein [Anaerolineae bacterium]